MEVIRSRQNPLIKHVIALGADGKARRASGEFVCAGEKLLREAISSGARLGCVLSAEPPDGCGPLDGCGPCDGVEYRLVTPALVRAVSPLKNSPGPVFTVKIPPEPPAAALTTALVLENVQDPGNVGTALRTADAFGIGLVALCGACADPYGPKAVRASMGAIFRQRVVQTDIEGLMRLLGPVPLYGAALAPGAADVRALPRAPLAVAVGNEGQGLTDALLAQCAGTVAIPMRPWAESLNAGVAAAILMWEMVRRCQD